MRIVEVDVDHDKTRSPCHGGVRVGGRGYIGHRYTVTVTMDCSLEEYEAIMNKAGKEVNMRATADGERPDSTGNERLTEHMLGAAKNTREKMEEWPNERGPGRGYRR